MAIAGSPGTTSAAGRLVPEATRARRFRLPRPSLAVQLVLLVVIFLGVPAIIYNQLHNADNEKKALLLRSVQEQGRLVAQALTPLLTAPTPPPLPVVGRELARFSSEEIQLRVLLQPGQLDSNRGFFYVASTPTRPSDYLEAEREQLRKHGVLDRLTETCAGDLPIAMRYLTPNGREDVVTSVTPVRSPSGCWAIVISHSAVGSAGMILSVPYWQSREVKIAALIYLGMAVLVLLMFVSIWQGLFRFGRLARDIRQHGVRGESFADRNLVPELSGVAREFDRLVEVMQDSATAIRRAAEDNSHAFKTPIAIIRHSVEPLQRIVAADNERGRRALKLIETSVDRLDTLVAQARRLDQATADMIDAPLSEIDLSSALDRLLTTYDGAMRMRGLTLERRLDPHVIVRANADLIETVFENIMENAIDFSPPKGTIRVAFERRGNEAEVRVTDQGPGVDPADVEHIFDRYFSTRATPGGGEPGESHLGIGLWIVRRSIEAINGSVTAENVKPSGLCVRIRLPLVQGTRRRAQH